LTGLEAWNPVIRLSGANIPFDLAAFDHPVTSVCVVNHRNPSGCSQGQLVIFSEFGNLKEASEISFAQNIFQISHQFSNFNNVEDCSFLPSLDKVCTR
jgi:hypothetical protein